MDVVIFANVLIENDEEGERQSEREGGRQIGTGRGREGDGERHRMREREKGGVGERQIARVVQREGRKRGRRKEKAGQKQRDSMIEFHQLVKVKQSTSNIMQNVIRY